MTLKFTAKFERDYPILGRQMQVEQVKISHFRRITRYNSNQKACTWHVFHRRGPLSFDDTTVYSIELLTVRATIIGQFRFYERIDLPYLGVGTSKIPRNSNSFEIFVQCTLPSSFIILCLIIEKLSCLQINNQRDFVENTHLAPLCYAGGKLFFTFLVG